MNVLSFIWPLIAFMMAFIMALVAASHAEQDKPKRALTGALFAICWVIVGIVLAVAV